MGHVPVARADFGRVSALLGEKSDTVFTLALCRLFATPKLPPIVSPAPPTGGRAFSVYAR